MISHQLPNISLLELLYIVDKHLVVIISVIFFTSNFFFFLLNSLAKFTSFIFRDQNKEQWYKFDDGDVTECKMNDDEEMKAQCFGGDYMGEVYDNNLKRMQLRRQKRWWNAYMLFYTRCDQQTVQTTPSIEQLSLAESRNCVLPMPPAIEKSVRSQNLRFLHSRNLFSTEFFNFVRKLVEYRMPASISDKMVSGYNFLFSNMYLLTTLKNNNYFEISYLFFFFIFRRHKLKNYHC